jgi:DNA (cytosine-5)-methyltransferase 1
MTRSSTVISLFTGAGGLDYGFEAAGFRTAVVLELDQRCAETLTLNRKEWPLIVDDIGNVPTERILHLANLEPEEADVLIGGPPCQPFSKSGFWATGQAGRLNDPRAATLKGYLRVLEEARPRAFLLENVEGLGFKGKDEGLCLIRNELDRINDKHGTAYRAFVRTLNAADFGVPQIRRRLFVIGARDGRSFQFPPVTHCDQASQEIPGWIEPHLTAWDAIHGLEEPKDAALEVRGKWAALLPTIPEGQNYLWHTERGGGEPLFGWRRRYWSFLLKLAKDLPSWTIQAQPGPATGPFHWNNRRLSVREMARLQTFPDDVIIMGTYGDAQRQLGNAVPSLLAEVLARAIRKQLLGHRMPAGSPSLLRARSASLSPPPSRPSKVPSQYLRLRGEHDAHPGTGKGYGALRAGMVEPPRNLSSLTARLD